MSITRVGAVGLAMVATGSLAGCTTTSGEATSPTAHVAQVPNPTQITRFDLVAYDTRHPSPANASRLLGACVVPDHGRVVQVGVARPLSKLGAARRGEGVALLFQSGITTTQRQAVTQCLRANGASINR